MWRDDGISGKFTPVRAKWKLGLPDCGCFRPTYPNSSSEGPHCRSVLTPSPTPRDRFHPLGPLTFALLGGCIVTIRGHR